MVERFRNATLKKVGFVDHLKNILERLHQPLMLDINPGIKTQFAFFKVWVNPLPVATQITYRINENDQTVNDAETVLTFNYEKQQYDRSSLDFNFETTYTLDNSVRLTDNRIRITIRAKVNGSIHAWTSIWGDFIVIEYVRDYLLCTNEKGTIGIIPKGVEPKIESSLQTAGAMEKLCPDIYKLPDQLKHDFTYILRKIIKAQDHELALAVNNMDI